MLNDDGSKQYRKKMNFKEIINSCKKLVNNTGGHGNPLQYFAWRIPWTEEPGRRWSIASHGVGPDWSDLAGTHTHILN